MFTERSAQFFVEVQLGAMGVDILPHVFGSPASCGGGLKRACQQATRQWTPRNEADAIRLACGNDFQFDHALMQIIEALFGDQTHEVAVPPEFLRMCDM